MCIYLLIIRKWILSRMSFYGHNVIIFLQYRNTFEMYVYNAMFIWSQKMISSDQSFTWLKTCVLYFIQFIRPSYLMHSPMVSRSASDLVHALTKIHYEIASECNGCCHVLLGCHAFILPVGEECLKGITNMSLVLSRRKICILIKMIMS